MKYVTFVIGAILSGCGAFAIWNGSDIVVVERGWTQVIAGATLLGAGVVTMALAALIHSIDGLRASLVAPREVVDERPAAVIPAASPVADAGLPPEQESAPAPAPFSAPRPARPRFGFAKEPAPLPAGDEGKSGGSAAESGAGPAPEPPLYPAFQPGPFPASKPARPAFEFPKEPVPHAGGADEPAGGAAEPVVRPDPAAPSIAAGGVRPRPDFAEMLRLAKKPAPFPPSSPEPAREEAEAPGQAEPEPRDLEPESAAPEPPVAPPREETVVAIRAPDRLPSVDEVDPALDWLRAGPAKPSIHPPAPAKFDEPAPPDAAAPPATLRQFESGGVNYTLYANGSILAESPEGQLRFADMTELRAHLARREPREPA